MRPVAVSCLLVAVLTAGCGSGGGDDVVVGGDGTVNEAVNGMLAAGGGDVALAVIPRGTGDDFARHFGIPTDLEKSLSIASSQVTRTVDVGLARFVHSDGSAGERYFANFAGAGISGAIVAGELGADGWYTGPVTVRFTCSDALSGIDRLLDRSCPPGPPVG